MPLKPERTLKQFKAAMEASYSPVKHVTNPIRDPPTPQPALHRSGKSDKACPSETLARQFSNFSALRPKL